jgi:hypothetical protein
MTPQEDPYARGRQPGLLGAAVAIVDAVFYCWSLAVLTETASSVSVFPILPGKRALSAPDEALDAESEYVTIYLQSTRIG